MLGPYLPFLKLDLRVCKFVKCLPFEFDKNLGHLVTTGKVWNLRIFKLECILTVVYAAALIANVCLGNLTMTGKMQGAAFLPIYIFAVVTRWNYSLEVGPIQVINSMVQFENKVLRGE